MKPLSPSSLGLAMVLSMVVGSQPLLGVTWTNGLGTNAWSSAGNWDSGEPTSTSDVVLPSSLSGTITLSSGELGKSLKFSNAYTLSGGGLTLPAAAVMDVDSGVTATISTPLTIVSGGFVKSGTGTLVLSGSSTALVGTSAVNAGTLRVANVNATGNSLTSLTLAGGATLEVATGITYARNVALADGATLSAQGMGTFGGIQTLAIGAAGMTFSTTSSTDVLILGDSANDLTGGSSTTVLATSGPGTVRLGFASNFPGSWTVATGRLELGVIAAAGNSSSSSITLGGGTLSLRSNSAINYTASPANNVLVTADSTILNDRTGSGASTVTHTLGSISLGGNVLTVAPGSNVASGTVGITAGTVTLSGNPTFQVDDLVDAAGEFTIGALSGGATARTVTKTGAGDLVLNGGSTALVTGSQFTASGGGAVRLVFPSLGTNANVNVSSTQNPLGSATASLSGGSLRLLAVGNGTATAQTYTLSTSFSLDGAITLDPDRTSGSGTNKTFILPDLALASGTVLTMAGDNTHGIKVTGALALSGNATLQGTSTTSKDGLLTLDGGISGGPSDALTIAGGTSPINLAINAASTYGGGTTITGGTTTLNASAALGSGSVSMSGGTLVINADNPFTGTATITGGTLRLNDADAISGNAVTLSGGTLDFRANATGSFSTGSVTLSGSSVVNVANNGTGSSYTFTLPVLSVSGTTSLSLTNANSVIANLSGIVLGGDLTLTHTINVRAQGISEDASSRRLLKAGTGTLDLEAASTHSGGTEILAGTISVEHATALGSGTLTLGDTLGTSTATASFLTGLTIANNIVARSGSSGTLTLDAPAGGVTWNGSLTLQRALALDNGGTTACALNGLISGNGGLTKLSTGTISFGNASNSFVGDLTVSDGMISVASDGALGDAANDVFLSGTDGKLKVEGTFTTSRTLSVSGTSTGVDVTTGNSLTLAAPLAGAGTFSKGDAGTLIVATGVDSSARGSAGTSITAGVLRLQQASAISAAGAVTMNSSGGTLELTADADTNFAHPIVTSGSGPVIHVDRATGGSGTNGRHTLGDFTVAGGSLTITGSNGYGLTTGAFTSTTSSTLTNDASAPLRLASLAGNPGASNRTITFDGSGDIEILGATTQGVGAGSFAITKNGTGTLRLGTGLSGFAKNTNIRSGTFDLNGLNHAPEALNFAGPTVAGGSHLVTGAGTLTLVNGLTYNISLFASPEASSITGNVDLGSTTQTLNIGNSAGATTELTIEGPISGSSGASLLKSGAGTLRLSGAGNTHPGLTSMTAGLLELSKSSGDAITSGGLSLTGGTVRCLASEQFQNSAAVSLSSANDVFLELNNFTETLGALTIAQTDPFDYSALKTGATGTVVLNGTLTLSNNADSASSDARGVLITGTGTDSLAATDGTLDLGGVTRTIAVTTTTVSANASLANATIETRVINGGILKTGPRTLFLTNPANTFSGGLQIAEGGVNLGSLAALGSSTNVAFSNTGTANAEFVLGDFSGMLATDFLITGSGSGTATILFEGSSTKTLVLSGVIDLQRSLIFDVVNGSTREGDSATLEVTGLIHDGAATSDLTKIGDGILKLASGNTYSGTTTIQRGVLAIPAESALGDGSSDIVIDGGCLQALASMNLVRDLTFGPAGGSLKVETGLTLGIPGTLTWDAGTSAFFGAGRTALTGTTTGSGGDLIIGGPSEFAFVGTANHGRGQVLSLQGTSALPSGNLSLVDNGVLELGNGNFTRALGTGPGEVLLDTAVGGGWAALGADRIVNLGGSGATLVWGQSSPAFLYRAVSGDDHGDLVLGSSTATHTVEFQNGLELFNGDTFADRHFIVNDGAAVLDARVSGDIALTAAPGAAYAYIGVNGAGSVEFSGDISGEIGLVKEGTGSARLSGSNTHSGSWDLYEGTLSIAGNASVGSPDYVYIETTAILDLSALTVPFSVEPLNGSISVNGTLDGDVSASAYLDGAGIITGDLTTSAITGVFPGYDGTLLIGGNFTLTAGSYLDIYCDGIVAETEYNRLRVTGSVTLTGDLFVGGTENIPLDFTGTLFPLLNDGTDAISGTFNGLPEGALISIGGGRALQVSYVANGDAGTVGNDVGLTVVPDAPGADLALTASHTLAVDSGGTITLTYTVTNNGPGEVTDAVLNVDLPANATFVGSSPSGTATAESLAVTLPTLASAASTLVTVTFTAPVAPAVVTFDASVSATPTDPVSTNNALQSVTAVLAGGRLELSDFAADADSLSMTLETLTGVSYVFESSIDLDDWTPLSTFDGDGLPHIETPAIGADKEFFRFRIVP